MSDLTQSLFDDMSPVPLEQVVFDYRLLSSDTRVFVLEKTDETQWLLKKTAENIILIGKNLQAVKDRLPHGMFLPWLKSEFGLSQKTANNFVHVAERFEGKLVKFTNLSVSALYALAAPDTPQDAIDEALQRAERGEKITHALAKQIIEAQEALKKAQEAEAKARAELEVRQQLLLKVEEESTCKIASLEEKIAELSTPSIQYVEKEIWPEAKVNELTELQQRVNALQADLETEKQSIPSDAQKKLDTLQKQLERLKEERKQQEEVSKQQEARIQKLNEDINTAIRNHEVAENADRIRQAWRLINSETHSCLMRLLGQWPTPVDVQSFDADDWARLDHLKSTLSRVLEECNALRYNGDDLIIEANGSPYALKLYGTQA